MKKFLLLAVFSVLCLLILAPGKVYAFDVTVGATTWYAWGQQNYSQKDDASNYDSTIKSDPALLYGPALSVKFSDDFNMTFVFLYGNFDATKNDGSKSNFKRSDSDLALNYRLNNYLKVFVGAKYLKYDIIPVKDNTSGLDDFRIKDMKPHTSYGSGIGLNAAVPITDNIFALATLSGLYLFGNEKIVKTDPLGNNPKDLKIGYHEYGVNTNLSLAYYIAPASTVISLGGRFQYLVADYKKNEIYLDSIQFMIYGVTLTATYTFSI